jgi:hypothetical protein
MRMTGTRPAGLRRALCVTLAGLVALVGVVSLPPAAGAPRDGDEDSLTALDVVMQVVVQTIAHLGEAGVFPKVYTLTGNLGPPALGPTVSSTVVSGTTVIVNSVDGPSSASFTASVSGSSNLVSGTTSSSGPFSGAGSNRPVMTNGGTWMDVETTFIGPGPFSSVIEDLKLVEIVRQGSGRFLDATGAQIETSVAGVLRRKTALSFAYAISNKGVLSGRGTGHSFIPGAPIDQQLVLDVAGFVQGGAGNFAGTAALLPGTECLIFVEVRQTLLPPGE